MRCLQVSELMSLRLDLLLTEGQEQALQDHLAVCDSCFTEWQRMQCACALFENIEFTAPSLDFQEKVMAGIRRHNTWLTILRGGGLFFLSLIGLIVLVIVPLASVVLNTFATPSIAHALVGGLVQVIDILDTLLRATGLVLRAMLAGPSWFILMGCVAMIGALALGWIRLVASPIRVTRNGAL